jgi:hypothetical protein
VRGGRWWGRERSATKPKPKFNIQQSNSEREIGVEVEDNSLMPLLPLLLWLLLLLPSLPSPLPLCLLGIVAFAHCQSLQKDNASINLNSRGQKKLVAGGGGNKQKEVEAQADGMWWQEERWRLQLNNQLWRTTRGSSKTAGRGAGRQEAAA